MANEKWVFIVQDGDRKEIARGTDKDIAKMFGVSTGTVNLAFKRHSIFQKKYRVTCEERKKVEQKTDVMDYLVRHLQRYGNTVLGDMEPIEARMYFHRLRNAGFKIKTKKRKDPAGTYWIIEAK